jgi:methyl-accepting chemotaxis protein
MDDTRCKINEECNRQNKLILAADKDMHSLYQGIRTVEKHVHEQSSSVQQSSASITQMAANIASVADMTKKADVVSDELSSTTEKGNNSITKAIKSILEIQKSSVEVQEIVKVIQKIASQTNLLSMNAAIEAAHAGEFGAGFAVVADEVRTLAASSAKSAKDIQLHIRSMVDKIDGGVQAIEEAGDAFKMIAENVEKNSSLIQTISRAMEEQEVGAKETMDATAEMVEATQAIHELVEKQSEYADNIKSMMETVVNSAEQVSGAVEENQNAGDNIVLSIRQVEETVNKNSNAVEIMQKSIQKYQI